MQGADSTEYEICLEDRSKLFEFPGGAVGFLNAQSWNKNEDRS